ncbi:hypothetical protein PG985_003275 [Apiospora marii]|uniref:Uncharacterized protein n=1 Tax=Apiospora marii TaxID=335849 RepID=A0ABR1RW99_9PEZI
MPKQIDNLLQEAQLEWMLVDTDDQIIPWFWRGWFRHAHAAATTDARRTILEDDFHPYNGEKEHGDDQFLAGCLGPSVLLYQWPTPHAICADGI